MEPRLRLIACALVLFGVMVVPSLAQQKGPHEAEFRTFYAAFVKAVQANDKEKIADMIAYPVSSWSITTKGNVQEGSIKDKADFLARFNVLFTNYMRLHLPKAKVQSTPDLWFTSWKDGYAEYAFEFKYVEGTGFKISEYDVGAY
ncbi:MAG TPA: hypothetical protein VKM94_04905 [Blastocatellia bacterium]|nr:hypothetical protein [Blastocatellia bacterium]